MKIILDTKFDLNRAILENYQLNTVDSQTLLQFVRDAKSVHESIAGIFYRDQYNKEHLLELKHQTVQAFLLAIESLALHLPLAIQYDDAPAPLVMWAQFWRLPQWFVTIGHWLFRPDTSYRNLFKHVIARAKVSESISK